MRYSHTQHAPLHWLLWATAVLMVVLGLFAGQEVRWVEYLLYGVAALVAVLALCFRTLTVSDEGDALTIRFGPIALFRKRVSYASMSSAAPARSAILDGWGVHWLPGRGWTWNLWGRDCVEIETTRGVVRVGTDDREGLADFLRTRLGGPAA